MIIIYLLLYTTINGELQEKTDDTETGISLNETIFQSSKNHSRLSSSQLKDGFCTEVYIDNLAVLGTRLNDVNINGQIVDYAKCVYVVIGKWVSYTDADALCRKHVKGECENCYGELVSIHSQQQNDAIMQIMQSSTDPNAPYSPYWVGLRQHCRGCEYEWSNFSPVDYVNWANGEPNNSGDGEDCGSLLAWDGTWNDDGCTRGFQFVCEAYIDAKHAAVNGDSMWQSQGGCKQGWTKYAKGCYLAVGGYSSTSDGKDQIRNFNDANTYCNGVWPGASLGILPNPFYQFFATAYTKSFGRELWIGGQSTTQDKTFHWIDGSRLTYSNWEPGQPSGSSDPNSLVDEMSMRTTGHMDQNNYRPGQWKDDDGTNTKGFLCSHQLSQSDESVSTSFCPDGWSQFGYACYQMKWQPTAFDNANVQCGQMWSGDETWSSTLATIVDEYENAFVASLLYDEQTSYDLNLNNVAGAHIGYSGVKAETGTGMEFKWVNDEFSATYTHWFYGEPDTVRLPPGAKACVYMNRDALWRTDWNCITPLPFVCKAVPPNAYIVPDDRGTILPCNETHGWYSTQTHEEQGYYCMKAMTDEVSFYEADDRCQRHHGGHLMSVHSASVNQRILEVTANTLGSKKWFWIGLQRNTAGGFMWSDGSATNFLNWGPTWGPNEEIGTDADCSDMGHQGLWGLELCTETASFLCQVPRAMENCANVPKAEREPCGYPGIIMDTCLKDFNCCWDGLAAPMSCFHPGGRQTGGSSGMTIAGAVFLSLFIWGVLLGGTVYYFTKMR